MSCAAAAQSPWTVQFGNHYAVQPNITYVVANNYEANLDLYERGGLCIDDIAYTTRPNCQYTVTPTAANAPTFGGPGAVSVTANPTNATSCTWTSSSDTLYY